MIVFPIMEQQQRSLVFTAAVGLIILAIIVGSIYYLVKFIQGRVASTRQSPNPSIEELVESSASASVLSNQIIPNPQIQTPPQNQPQVQNQPTAASNIPADKKVFNGGAFQFVYPKDWGILACDNSQNIELDPTNSADSKIACGTAAKPITVLVGDVTGCEGQTAKVGNIDVVKSQETEGSYTKYQWCTKTTPVFNITHRVSEAGERATSKQDFSKQIEEMIANLSFSRGS